MVNLAECIQKGELNAEIAVVISSRSDVGGNDRTRELGLEPHIVRRKDFQDTDQFSDHLWNILLEENIDLICQCGWLCYWTIRDEFEGRVMNIHPGLLPKYGGKGMWGHHVHQAVIDAGEPESGCTVHFVNNEYDAGPIILQRSCQVLPDDTADVLAQRVFNEECLAYPEAIRLFSEDRLEIKNNHVLVK